MTWGRGGGVVVQSAGTFGQSEKKSKNIFALDPQFLFYNIKVLYKIGCLQKTRVQKIQN